MSSIWVNWPTQISYVDLGAEKNVGADKFNASEIDTRRTKDL